MVKVGKPDQDADPNAVRRFRQNSRLIHDPDVEHPRLELAIRMLDCESVVQFRVGLEFPVRLLLQRQNRDENQHEKKVRRKNADSVARGERITQDLDTPQDSEIPDYDRKD